MDQFFHYDFLDEVAWFEADLPANPSAFVSYAEQPSSRSFAASGTRNVNKRMVELLIKRSKVPAVGTTSDKNTIMQIAAEKILELQSSKEELRKQNSELEAILAARRDEEVVEGAKIRFRVGSPSSGIDSMLSVLKCLKETGSETRAIQVSERVLNYQGKVHEALKCGTWQFAYVRMKPLNNLIIFGETHGLISMITTTPTNYCPLSPPPIKTTCSKTRHHRLQHQTPPLGRVEGLEGVSLQINLLPLLSSESNVEKI
ncbi:hypothetical protein RJ639_002062 [Escallonia herrerae]|uniref:BHLH domain-containing protein n=1 Tax=Escallonia herrerae TaxID=1293975 RepID=A0AA89BJH7_9ASTE|nr:hypothetical protein RJ639_002062 [Escallonia herrerae]